MQKPSQWSPPTGALGRLVAAARDRAPAISGVIAAASRPGDRPPFGDRLSAGSGVAVIAEIKRSSPSMGDLDTTLDAGVRAGQYERGGAGAVSVLTEPDEFGGRPEDITRVLGTVSIPILKKDFHIEDRQLIEAALLGASAVLLIARALEPSRLDHLCALARTLGLEPLVEVRTEAELRCAIDARATVIGVNARDLETLAVEPEVVERILPLVPAGCLAVAESGIRSRVDVERVASLGADAVLVGSALSKSTDPVAAVKALVGVRRTIRAS
ncbi:MAG: indole-3-glycerol phosphate synthase TrpC [Gemmatimonadota bacterium]